MAHRKFKTVPEIELKGPSSYSEAELISKIDRLNRKIERIHQQLLDTPLETRASGLRPLYADHKRRQKKLLQELHKIQTTEFDQNFMKDLQEL